MEPFHRVYSPPEPPPQSRRPAVVGVLTVFLVVIVLGAAGFVAYGRHAATPARAAASATATEQARAGGPARDPATSSAPAPAPATPRLFRLAPQACVVVSPDTVRRLVPAATIARGGGATASTCDYLARSGSRYRELRVETQIFAPAVSPDPVDDAKVALAGRWADARTDPVVRTVEIEHVTGLGDEAYQRYATDKGQPTVVGEVVVRVRNSLAAVSYAEDAPAGGRDGAAAAAVRQRCVTEATAVAREILRAFQ
ncbi:MAG TPA: hypothetical protein VF069_18470 [Streptosporangiaceae bacterium]